MFNIKGAVNPVRVWRDHAPLLVLIALVTYFWWPSLWDSHIIIHADAAHHGLSLLSFHAQALHRGRELLWDSGIYGGHPLFAEGQGGFASPLNILIAFLFEPEYGIGVFHWLSMLLSGIGVYCLALTLSIRPWAAVFASLATVFSGIWIGFQYNLSVSGALTWLPWLLASVEFWLNRPTLWRASLMSIAAALLIFAGYPHIAHGAAIYLVIRLSALLFTQESRARVWGERRRLIQLGTWAVILAAGLSAVQLLPLVELIGQSHRDTGTSLPFAGLIGLDSYIRGLLFFNADPAATTNFFKLESLASSLVALLFGAVIFAKPPARIVGHVLAAIFLFNLGMEFSSPLFRFVYEYHLIPGLHNYRIMHPFFPLAVVGMAVVAAYVLDNASDTFKKITTSWTFGLCGAAYFLLWVTAVVLYFDTSLTFLNIVEPVFFLVLCAILLIGKKLRLVATLTVSLSAAGVISYKSEVFNFYDATVLRQPESIQIIRKDPQLENFKATTDGGVYVFIASNTQGLDKYYQDYLKRISPFPALNWGVPSIDGVLGLALSRRTLIQRNIEEEIEGSSATQPGSRIIDVMGIKYMSRHAPTNAAGLELIYHDAADNVLIYRNNHARPRFQLYERAKFVDSPEDALQQLVQREPGLLFVERLEASSRPQELGCDAGAGQPARMEVTQTASKHYQMTVSTECPIWLFVADANYPGWQASIDDEPVPLFSAQILGKAVRVPPGEHRIQFDYVPRSFYIGLAITLVSLALALISLLLALRKRYRP
jgi:hypothetical protein